MNILLLWAEGGSALEGFDQADMKSQIYSSC